MGTPESLSRGEGAEIAWTDGRTDEARRVLVDHEAVGMLGQHGSSSAEEQPLHRKSASIERVRERILGMK